MPASLEMPPIIQTLSLQLDKIQPINHHVILHHAQHKEVFDNKSRDCFGKGSLSGGSRPKSRLTVG
jgi:hypothetical protein